MEITTETRTEHTVVVYLAGRLDLLATADAKRQLNQMVSEGYYQMVVDLAEIIFIDSSGLTALISGLKAARLAGGNLHLSRPGDEVLTILELTKLDRVIKIFSSVEEAVASYG